MSNFDRSLEVLITIFKYSIVVTAGRKTKVNNEPLTTADIVKTLINIRANIEGMNIISSFILNKDEGRFSLFKYANNKKVKNILMPIFDIKIKSFLNLLSSSFMIMSLLVDQLRSETKK